MKTVILIHSLKERYNISESVMLMFKLFYLTKKQFYDSHFNLVYLSNFIKDNAIRAKINNFALNIALEDKVIDAIQKDAYNNLLDDIRNDKYNNAILLAFQNVVFPLVFEDESYNLLKSKNIKIIIWEDDIHEYNRAQKIAYKKPIVHPFFDKPDLIITPSRLYFENINSSYLDKTIQSFYCFNEHTSGLLRTSNYSVRKSKILLSGSCGDWYPIRKELLEYYTANPTSEFSQYIELLNYPSRNRKEDLDKKE